VQAEAPGPVWRAIDHRGRLLMPGFIDTHVHCPQLGVMASHGTGLLDWLHTYTFPAERAGPTRPWRTDGIAALFLDALLAHGTTAAVVFPTVHAASADALFTAQKRGHAPDRRQGADGPPCPGGLCDDVAGAEHDCIDLIQRWHGNGAAATR
jgi:guanine deaminase